MSEAPEVMPEEQPADAQQKETAPAGDENSEDTAADTSPTKETEHPEAAGNEPTAGEHEITPEQVVESLLFASDRPLTLQKIVAMLGTGTARDIRNHIKTLNNHYEQTRAAFRIEQLAGGYQMLTLPAFNTWIRKLKQSKQDSKLSQASLETLALVAYKQPVVRADIEVVRGVSTGDILNRLREMGLIKIVGRAEDLGRPMLYGTTKRFLEVFGLSGLDELPEVEELQPPS